MNPRSKAWLVAASIGAVETLKDQGFCRWNHAFRLHAKPNLARSYTSQANKLSSAALVSDSDSKTKTTMTSQDEKLKQSEESLRKVMYLSCWGPN